MRVANPLHNGLTALAVMSLAAVGCDNAADSPPTAEVHSEEAVTETEPAAGTAPAAAGTAPEIAAEAAAVPSEFSSLETQDSEIQILDWDQCLAAAREHRGQVVVLWLWTLGSESTVRDFPVFSELPARFPGRVTCIAVNADYLGVPGKPPEYYRPAVEEFVRAYPGEFRTIVCDEPADTLMDVLDLTRPAAVYVFDAAGQLTQRFDETTSGSTGPGFTFEADVEPWVRQLVTVDEL